MSDISPLVGANAAPSGTGFQGTVETKDSTKTGNEGGQKIESNEQDAGLGVQIDAKV